MSGIRMLALLGCLSAGCAFRQEATPKPQEDAGAKVALLAPPPGLAAPTNLVRAVIAGAASATLEGVASHARVLPPDDAACGVPQGCLALELDERLQAGRRYPVRVPGGPELEILAGGAADTEAPVVTVTPATSDGCTVFRVRASEPAWAQLALVSDGAAARFQPGAGLATAHELAVAWREPAGTHFRAQLVVKDLAGNEAVTPLDVVAAAPPTWAISEVLANPKGPEPAQEWVELISLGQSPQSLAGLRLGDGSAWNALPDVTVPPGERVLVVARRYDAAAPGGDAPPAPGTVLARVAEASLGRDGLRNTGESLVLADAAGTPLSTFTAYLEATVQGRSVERIRPGSCDVRGNQAFNTARTATPGGRNSVEK